MSEIGLGWKYRDEISGFVGVATARTQYLYGCVRVLLEGKCNGGDLQENWFDEPRLVRAREPEAGFCLQEAPS